MDGPQKTRSRSVWRVLRSRKLALILLIALVSYAGLGTLTNGAMATTAVGRALVRIGLSSPYATPVFIALIALVALSTAACAGERLRRALHVSRAARYVDAAFVDRLRRTPGFAVDGEGDRADELLDTAARVLRSNGMKVVHGPRLLTAHSGSSSLWASALFHWSMVLLMLVIGLGRLTRAETLIGVPVGDAAAIVGEHSLRTAGAWYRGRLDTYQVRVDSLDMAYRLHGIDRGASPVARVFRGGVLATQGRIYLNHPLRTGSLLVHHADYGFALDVAVADATGARSATQTVLLDFDATDSGTQHKAFALSGLPGGSARVTLTLPLDHVRRGFIGRMPADPRAIVTVSEAGRKAVRATVREGGSLALGGGYRLVLQRVRYYERLRLVDDWSVPFIYALYALVLLSAGLALLQQPRSVAMLVAEGEEGHMVHLLVRCRREDYAFKTRITGALRKTIESRDDDR